MTKWNEDTENKRMKVRRNKQSDEWRNQRKKKWKDNRINKRKNEFTKVQTKRKLIN